MKKKATTILIPLDRELRSNDIIINNTLKAGGIVSQQTIDAWNKVSATLSPIKPQRLIIVNDSKICKGDWYIDDTLEIRQAITDDGDYWSKRPDYKKIISSYPFLSPSNAHALINTTFIQEWIDANMPETIEIEYESPSESFGAHLSNTVNGETPLKLDADGCIIASLIKKDEEAPESAEDIKEIVLAEYKKGNIVISTFEGLKTAPLMEIAKQGVDGLLYDLNRTEPVILTFIEDQKWINDYASTKVIRELKRQLDEMKEELHRVNEQLHMTNTALQQPTKNTGYHKTDKD